MKKVILTGFEPFGNYAFNPTQESTEYFNHIGIVSSVRVVGVVLPCTYYGAFQALYAIVQKEKPDAILSTGLSSEVNGIRIETTFRNVMDGKYPDANGYRPIAKPIIAEEKAKKILTATADTAHLANILRQNDIPVEISTDSHAFICNSLAYLTSEMIIENKSPIRNMFIHIPWTDNYKNKITIESHKIFLNKEKYYKGLELLISHI